MSLLRRKRPSLYNIIQEQRQAEEDARQTERQQFQASKPNFSADELRKMLASPFGQRVVSGANWAANMLLRPSAVALRQHELAAGQKNTAYSILRKGEPYTQYDKDLTDTAKDTYNAIKGTKPYGDRYPTWESLPDNLKNNFKFVTSLQYDPTTYMGGLTSAGLRGFARFGLPAAVSAGKVIEKIPGGDRLTMLASIPFRLAETDPEYKIKLAEDLGNRWLDRYAQMWGIRRSMGSTQNQLAREFGAKLIDAMRGLKPSEQEQVYKAIDRGTIKALPNPRMEKAAHEVEDLTDQLAYIEGDPNLRINMKAGKFTPAQWTYKYAKIGGRVRQTGQQFRGGARLNLPGHKPGGGYIPAIEPKLTEMAPGEKQVGFFTNKNPNPYLKPRENIPASATFNPQETQRALIQRALATGKNVAERQGQIRLSNIALQDMKPGPFKAALMQSGAPIEVSEDVARFFQRTVRTGPKTVWQNIGDGVKYFQDLAKAGIFILPFGHEKNILFLAALSKPQLFPESFARYAKTALMGQDKWFKEYAPELYSGVIQASPGGLHGPGSLSDRTSRFTELLHYIGGSGQPRTWMREMFGSPFRIAGSWYDLSQGQLWKMDDAFKATQWRDEIRRGVPPELAALTTNARLVDYDTRSQLTNAISYVAPFAVFATKMPSAVVRSSLENPFAITTMAKLSPALVGGRTKGTQPGSETAISSPQGEVVQDIGTVASYAKQIPNLVKGKPVGNVDNSALRRVLAPQIKALLPGTASDPNYWRYGLTPGQYAPQNVPGIQQALQFTGQDMFQTPAWQSLVGMGTGIHQVPATNQPIPKSPYQMRFDDIRKKFADQYPNQPNQKYDEWTRNYIKAHGKFSITPYVKQYQTQTQDTQTGVFNKFKQQYPGHTDEDYMNWTRNYINDTHLGENI